MPWNAERDTGWLGVAFTSSVDYDIQFIGGVKTPLFGEGMFYATLPRVGAVCGYKHCQLAAWLAASRSMETGRRKEGSILGGLIWRRRVLTVQDILLRQRLQREPAVPDHPL